MFIASQKQGYYITFVTQWFFSIGGFIVSFIAAVPCTLLFEVPFMNIEKTILFPPKPKSIKVKTEIIPEGASPLLNKSNGKYSESSNEETGDSSENTPVHKRRI